MLSPTHHTKTNKCLSSTLFSKVPPSSQRTMEEVWKDINLSSFSETGPPAAIRLYNHNNNNPHHHYNPTSASNLRSMILQDFLARPFATTTTTTTTTNNNNNNNKHSNNDPPTTATTETTLYNNHPVASLPPPATVLSLNSGPDRFRFLDNSDPLALASSDSHSLHSNTTTTTTTNNNNNNNNNNNVVSSFSCPFEEALATSSSFGKKRFPETETGSGDRRHKRMIKNRESAARSRARKQAYTNELELEVAHLMEENAKLKRQQEQSQYCQAAVAQLPKKNTLQRTSTAPF